MRVSAGIFSPFASMTAKPAALSASLSIGLRDGSVLSALGYPLTGGEFGVLADDLCPGQDLVFREELDRRLGQHIVASYDGVDIPVLSR